MSENAKVFVLDTNVLIHDPKGALNAFEDNTIVLPIRILEELNVLKKNPNVGHDAREVSRQLDALCRKGNIGEGVRTENGGILKVDYNGRNYHDLPLGLEATADNSILLTAQHIKSENEKQGVIIVSKDINVRVTANACGIAAQDYENDKVENLSKLYTGFTEIAVQASDLRVLHSEGYLEHREEHGNVMPNQGCKLIEKSSGKNALALFKKSQNAFCVVDKPSKFTGRVNPKNEEQALAYNMASDTEIKLLTFSGTAGTGKTLMALLAAYHQLGNPYDKIIIFRPTKEVGDPLGFLPGDLPEKFAPWTRPIISNLKLIAGGQQSASDTNGADKGGRYSPIAEMLRAELIEMLPINHVRGDTFHNSLIIIDEGQNLTTHQIKTVITRAGEGSKVIVTGDLEQIDDPYLDARSSGLSKVISVFPGDEMFGHLKLIKGERSHLAEVAAKKL